MAVGESARSSGAGSGSVVRRVRRRCNSITSEERSGTQSPLTKAFVDRFGIVKDANTTATSNQPGQLPSARLLSDNLVLTAYGKFDFSRFKLPDGKTGLFETAPAASPYLIRGRTDLVPLEAGTQNTVYNRFLGSDYLMTRLGLLPGVAKRLGDAWYETQLVQEQLYAMTGRKYIVAGTSSDYDLMKGLMDAGVLAGAQLGLAAGQALNEQQQAALTQDMVWPEWQEVDGQRVLVPKVYLAHKEPGNNPANTPTGVGALIVGREVKITAQDVNQEGAAIQSQTLLSINASGKVSGSGSYSGGTSVAIVAGSVDLKNASVQSAGWLQLETKQGDLNLTATQITAAGNATVKSAGELNLLAEKHEAHVVRADGSRKDEVKFETTNIKAGGNLTLQSTQDLTVQGSKLSAGQDLKVESTGGSVDLQAVTNTEDKVVTTTTTTHRGFFGRTFTTSTSIHQEDVQGVELTSGGNTQVKALGDLTAESLQLRAGGDAALGAAGAVAITSGQAYSSTQTGSDVRQSLQTDRSQIEAGGNVTVYGAQSVKLSATDVDAGGKALVQSKGDIELGYNTDTDQRNWTTSHSSGNIIKSKTTTTNHTTVDKTAEVTKIDAAQVQVLGNNITSLGADITGQTLVQVEGVGKTALYAVNEEHLNKADSRTSSSFIGITYSNSKSSDSSLNTTALGTTLTSQEAIKVGVGTVTDVRGAIMTAPKIDIVRSAGADTSKPGELILGTSSNTTETSHTETTTTAGVWKAESGHGSTTETANNTVINGKLNIGAGINTTVQIPEGNLKDQIASLSQQPGMGYLKDLASNPNIKWEQVKLAHDEWSYSQQGLTPAGAALLSIAIAVYTGGMGAELLGTTTTAAGAAVNAGFSALAASAGVSFVNNGGDIGKTLKDLGSKDSVKNIALAMVTAGVLSELNASMGLDKVTVKDGFTANLGKAVVNNLANAGVTSALTGTSLEDNIKTGLVSAFISAGAGSAALEIGNQTANDQVAKALAHALAGCMAGGASGGKQGCESGAIGAVVGELAAQWVNPTDDPSKMAKTLEIVKVISAAAGALTGDGSAASVSTAVMTGVNAALNNRMLHPTEANLIKNNAQRYAQERFGTSNPSAQQIEAAQAELANTAQSMLDNNMGVVVPYVGKAADFLAKLKVEYMQQYGTLNLSGTAAAAGGPQQLFYATVEQKNMPWLNQGLADPKITGLIVRTPINPPKTADTIASNRDRLTGLPLDEKGRYEVNLTLGDKNYSPKFYPCATAECVKSGGNLDMGDVGTQAYVKALDKKIMDDINTAATVGAILTPVGVVGTIAGYLGPLTSVISGMISDEGLKSAFKEGLQAGAAKYLNFTYKFSEALSNRIVAAVDLAGGWQAFLDRASEELKNGK